MLLKYYNILMIPPARRADADPAGGAGRAHSGPLLTPDKIANSLRVHTSHRLGTDVEVSFIAEQETGLPDGRTSEEVAEWLELQDWIAGESGGKVLEHLVIAAEVPVEEGSVLAVRDCHFLVSRYVEGPGEAAVPQD